MEKKTYPLYHGGQLMPWAKGTVVKNPGGFVYLSGTEGRDPETDEVVEGIGAQARMCLEKIKARLEEMGSSLDNICHEWIYIAGPQFPVGVRDDPKFQEVRRVQQEFFKEHCPDLCFDKNPPAITLIGVAGLARKEMLVEILVFAVL